MAGIKEIALKAGVSTSAVSKALNGYTDIGESTRKHILKIAEDLNYSPNIMARSLASQKPKTLGLIFSDIKETDSNGNIIFRLFLSSTRYCQNNGYEMLVVHTDPEAQMKKSLETLCSERMLGGAILYGFKPTDPYILQLRELSMPFVLIDVFLPWQNTATVTIDNEAAILEMLTYVVSRNKHGKVVFVNGLADTDIAKIRCQAFEKAKDKLGLTSDFIECNADFLESKAFSETLRLLKKHKDISCFFCASDLMSIGVMRALRESGKKIPDDIAVTGFDGIQVIEYLTPPLTTIVQDFKKIGQLASQSLIDMLNEEHSAKIVYAPYSIHKGQSV